MLTELNKIVEDIKRIPDLKDAWIDRDCAYEGGFCIEILIEDDKVDKVAKELGYD